MDWLDFLHVVDSSFPTGAYAHSAGLETLAPDGRHELELLLSFRIREVVGRFELVFLLHAYTSDVGALDNQYHAMLLPREAREASSLIGASLLRGALDVVAIPPLDFPHHHYPIVFGALMAALKVEPDLAASAYALQYVRSLVSAAQRLGRLGQRDTQRVLHRLKPALREAVATARNLTLDTTGAFCPAWDIASMRHEHAQVRMFAS